MPLDPSMFMGGGPPGGGGGGMPPGGGGDPGMGTPGPMNPMGDPALQALDGLNPKGPNPTQAIQKMGEALDLAYRLISTVISQAQMMSPKAVKNGHGIARSILNMKSDLYEEAVPGPMPDLSLGMGMAGAPSAMSPGSGGGASMAGMP